MNMIVGFVVAVAKISAIASSLIIDVIIINKMTGGRKISLSDQTLGFYLLFLIAILVFRMI